MSKITSLNESNASALAEQAYAKHGALIDAYIKGSARTAIGESISNHEIAALGQQFQQFENYRQFCESNASISSLGKMPQVALDVITAAQADSILPLLASIQPMQEEHGIAYFRNIYAAQASGGYTKGQDIAGPLSRDNVGDGTLGAARKTATKDMTNGTTDYTFTLNTKLRRYQVEVMAADLGMGKDNGEGKIMGIGLQGEVNYETGEVKVKLLDASAATGKKCSVLYNIDIDAVDEVERIQSRLETVEIVAEISALASDIGAFTNFAFSQRFGTSATDEVAQDLSTELTRVLNTRAIKRLLESYTGTAETWDRNAPNGVSYAEHKLTFVDAIATIEKQLHLKSGMNSANRYIVGTKAAAVLRGMPDFEPAADVATTSVGLYGYYDGIPVIRATGIAGDADMYAVANSGNYFNAPLVYAPYMPLMVTSTIQDPRNPFRSTVGAGEWSAMKAVNPNLIAKLTIQNV